MKKNKKEPIEYLSWEMRQTTFDPIPKWRWAILNFVSKLLNVKQNYPFRWSYKGRKLETWHRSKSSATNEED